MTKTLSPCRCIQTASCGGTIWHILLVGNCEAVPSPWVSLCWFLKGYIGKFESFRCLSLPKWPKFRCLSGLLSCAPCHGKPHFSLPCSSWEQPGGAGTSSWIHCVSTLMGVVGSLCWQQGGTVYPYFNGKRDDTPLDLINWGIAKT